MEIHQTNGFGLPGARPISPGTVRKSNSALTKILHKLATAKRITRASDDAAGLSVAEQLSTQVRGFKMASHNISDALSALNIADGASHEISNILQRQRELAIQASSDTLTDEQRSHLDIEYQDLTQEIDRMAAGTEFNTQDLINGQGLGSGSAQIMAGANAGDTRTLPSITMTAQSLGITGASIADSGSASMSITTIDTALESMGAQRSTIGAIMNTFESTQNNLAVAETNTQAAESILRDQDMAMGIAEMTKNQLLQESGLLAFQRFNDISANHIVALLG